jgi:hypothetical protein
LDGNNLELDSFFFELAFKTFDELDYFRQVGLGTYAEGNMFHPSKFDTDIDLCTGTADSTCVDDNPSFQVYCHDVN